MLSKMKILAFKDCNYTKFAGVYTAQINPDGYSLGYSVEFDEAQAGGTSGKSARMNVKKPDNLTLNFIFDSTGVIPPPIAAQNVIREAGIDTNIPFFNETQAVARKLDKEIGVEADLLLFREFLIGMDSEKHSVRHLILHWGTLLFKCVLTTLEVQYTLFNPNGVPIRATATATFKGSIPDLLREAKEKFNSPDLTHVRTVKASDTIFNLCEEIYGDPALYIHVAEANGLTQFRNLQPGITIFFPPIEKAAS